MASRPAIFVSMDQEWEHLHWVRDQHVVTSWARREPLLAPCGTPVGVVARCRRRGEVRDANAVVGALLRLADDDRATRTLLQAVLPGLAAHVSRIARRSAGHRPLPGWDSVEDLAGEIVVIGLERIKRLAGTSPEWPASAIVGGAWRRVRTTASTVRRAEQLSFPLEHARELAAPADRPNLELLAGELSAAVQRDRLRRHDAAVIYTTRVLGFTPAEVASASGRDVRAVRAQRSRAERVLVASWA